MEAQRKRLLSMTYNEIRALCRQKGLKASGTKEKLVTDLSITMEIDRKEESMVEENMEVDENALNRTFTISPKNEGTCNEKRADMTEDAEISMDESVVTDNVFAVNTGETLPASVAEKEPVVKRGPVIARPVRAAASRIPAPNTSVGKERPRFNHQKLFAGMKDVVKDKQSVMQLHEKHMKAVPESVTRLATPKNQKPPVRRFPTPKTPTKMQFGDVRPEKIESVQIPYDPKAQSSRVLRPRAARPQLDAKQLTMKKKPTASKNALRATIPNCSERIEQLATPKSAGRVIISKERKSYTPNTTPYRYVDTTKMSDAEFRAYQARQKSQSNCRVNFHDL